MAEAHVHNRQLRVYGNGLPGYMDASLNGGHLLHVMDDVVKKGMAFNRLLLILCVENLRRGPNSDNRLSMNAPISNEEVDNYFYPNVSNNINSLIFKAVQDFITQSGRFAME